MCYNLINRYASIGNIYRKEEVFLKNFEDFKNYINNNCLTEINNTVKSKMEEQAKEVNLKGGIDKLAWQIKTLPAIHTMVLLEKYHEWLNS